MVQPKKKSVSEHPCLLPDLRRNDEVLFTIEYDVSCGLFISGLYYVEVCFLYTQFVENFYRKWILNFVKSFLCIYWDEHIIFFEHIIFIHQFVNVMYHIDWFAYIELNHPCIPGINSTWSWCIILFMYCWIQFADILLRIFASMFINDIDL